MASRAVAEEVVEAALSDSGNEWDLELPLDPPQPDRRPRRPRRNRAPRPPPTPTTVGDPSDLELEPILLADRPPPPAARKARSAAWRSASLCRYAAFALVLGLVAFQTLYVAQNGIADKAAEATAQALLLSGAWPVAPTVDGVDHTLDRPDALPELDALARPVVPDPPLSDPALQDATAQDPALPGPAPRDPSLADSAQTDSVIATNFASGLEPAAAAAAAAPPAPGPQTPRSTRARSSARSTSKLRSRTARSKPRSARKAGPTRARARSVVDEHGYNDYLHRARRHYQLRNPDDITLGPELDAVDPWPRV